MKRLTFAEVVHRALHAEHHPIKAVVRVPAVWKRDARGRFVKLLRRAHLRHIKDRTRMVSNLQLLAENVRANNALLRRLIPKD